MPDGPPLLRLEHIARSFDGNRIVALRDVDLSIHAGECVAIVGRSGSGKSCLLSIASGIDQPTAGRVLWQGQPVASRRRWTDLRRRHIGIVFQDFNLLPTLSALQNVEVALIGAGVTGRAQSARAAAALDLVGLTERSRHLPHQMSGGERQRVAIARGLALDPDLLLADEPTGNLDSANAAHVADLLLALQARRRMTLLVVTHDEGFASRCARRVHLHDGRIIEDSARDASDAPEERVRESVS